MKINTTYVDGIHYYAIATNNTEYYHIINSYRVVGNGCNNLK